MAGQQHDPILITGCSTGIGRAAALDLHKRGHTVIATARRLDSIADLAEAGLGVRALDVTDEESMSAAVGSVVSDYGHVGSLVNNAGYGLYGAIEDTDLAGVRKMFDTNVFGLVRLSQLVLPSMRARGAGRIVNLSSMAGRVTFPVGGFYHATKYAVESLSDALRYETAAFGVQVSLIEPGPIRSRFEDTIMSSLAEQPADSVYRGLVERAADFNRRAYANPLMCPSPKAVVRAIRHAIEAERPRPRYLLSLPVKFIVAARTLGGDRVWDAFVRRQITR